MKRIPKTNKNLISEEKNKRTIPKIIKKIHNKRYFLENFLKLLENADLFLKAIKIEKMIPKAKPASNELTKKSKRKMVGRIVPKTGKNKL